MFVRGGDGLGYKVKWVEENLGVTRKALRNFEEKGLMPKNKGEYRDYSDEDIDRIWIIRVLQGMGYTLTEICDMSNDKNFDFDSSLETKVKELEAKKEKVDRHLDYAKTIKLTGRFPSRPKVMGSVKFDDFYEKSLNEWNMNKSTEEKYFLEIADKYLTLSPEEFNKSDLGMIFDFFEKIQAYPELLMEGYIIPREIAKRESLGASNSEVQLLVKMMYESRIRSVPKYKEITLNQFVRFEASSYKNGDVARMNEQNFGKEGCNFIADAIAVFGGYQSYDEVVD